MFSFAFRWIGYVVDLALFFSNDFIVGPEPEVNPVVEGVEDEVAAALHPGNVGIPIPLYSSLYGLTQVFPADTEN
ncbi:hypothetical protein RhiJN_25595 [Ceratobasidium sp. AG-Ba]|nr:hypothetical protein RhiJN_25595 [Ceratobasidium sp. AG-Ba]